MSPFRSLRTNLKYMALFFVEGASDVAVSVVATLSEKEREHANGSLGPLRDFLILSHVIIMSDGQTECEIFIFRVVKLDLPSFVGVQ